MNCPIETNENADVLLAYCARTLDADTVAILESHMAVCPQCVHLRDEQRAVWNALDSWEVAPVSADFDRRLYGRIHKADAAPWYRRGWDYVLETFRPIVWRPAFPLAAAGVLVVAGFLLDQRPRGAVTKPSTPEIRVSLTEADQVERTLEDMEMLRQFDLVPKDNKPDSKSM
ncbi:MAG: anti-sigma factor family protein [Bryobacteraceae bacterium]